MPLDMVSPSDLEHDSADVVVLGGGVIGVACARELARRGRRVVVLERDRIGSGCSYGNAGWLTASVAFPLPAPGLIRKATKWLLDPESPLYIQPRLDPSLFSWLVRFLLATRRAPFERNAAALVALARWSVDAWEEVARRTSVPFGFERKGMVAIYESAKGLAAGRADAERVARLGIPSESWSEAELRQREPAVRGATRGAVYYPSDAHCEPYGAVTALAAEAKAAGATLVEGTDVTAVERNGADVGAVITSRGRFAARHFVLAGGAWSGVLGRTLGLRLPMLGGKGYSLVLPPLSPHPTRSLYLSERKVAVNPHAHALRLSGTLELVDTDLSINQRRVNAIVRSARALLDLPDPLQVRELWCGLRPCLPDGMPLIGRARGRRNLWLATGHQMTGLKTSLGTARLLAELMGGEPTSFDPAPFRAERYG